MNKIATVAKNQLETQKTYDALAAWLRDCSRKGDISGLKHAEIKLKELEGLLAGQEGEKHD